MNIEKDLKREGIEVINKLDTLSANSLASSVANRLCKAFPNEHFVYQSLFINLSRLPMYVAKIPEGLAEANYFYKNSSVICGATGFSNFKNPSAYSIGKVSSLYTAFINIII